MLFTGIGWFMPPSLSFFSSCETDTPARPVAGGPLQSESRKLSNAFRRML